MKRNRIDDYWISFFGLQEELQKSHDVIVTPHNHLGDYNGSWIFNHEKRIIISVPHKMEGVITAKVKSLKSVLNDPFSKDFINYLFNNNIERVIGPVYQGFYDKTDRVFPIAAEVVKVGFAKYSEAIKALSDTGDSEGWLNSGIKKDNDGLFGYFFKDQLVSLGCFDIIQGDVGFIGVYADPRFRGIGFSQEVLKKMVMELSKSGKLIRYQTLLSNIPSIKIAEKIGFNEYAQNIAIRLL